MTAVAIFGMENLQELQLQVDQEVNLLQGVTFAEGITLQKVEAVQNGVRSGIPNPGAYAPEFPGAVSIILTLSKSDGSTLEFSCDLTVKALEYHAIDINNIKPVDILPIIGQIETGDKNVYSYIENLRVAESTKIRDMMWEYGTGKYSKEQYQELMDRLNTGMTLEIPA
jgi:hypothetical protein